MLRRKLPLRIPPRGMGLYLTRAPFALQRAQRLTTAQRDELADPVDLFRIYNVTTEQFELYDAAGTAWVAERDAYDS